MTAIFCRCRQKRERGKILKSSGQKYDVVIQCNAVNDDDIPRVSRHTNAPNAAFLINTNTDYSQTRNAINQIVG
jgi:hypothetical protein